MSLGSRTPYFMPFAAQNETKLSFHAMFVDVWMNPRHIPVTIIIFVILWHSRSSIVSSLQAPESMYKEIDVLILVPWNWGDYNIECCVDHLRPADTQLQHLFCLPMTLGPTPELRTHIITNTFSMSVYDHENICHGIDRFFIPSTLIFSYRSRWYAELPFCHFMTVD